MPSQAEKGRVFRSLHERPGPFLIPNPWYAGTARTLERRGFEAIAITSAGCAISTGRVGSSIRRDEMLAHISAIASAVTLPVHAELDNGYADDPALVAVTIQLAAEAGAVGASIDDATGRPDRPIYEAQHAAERIRAAVEAARALPFSFVLTACASAPPNSRSRLASTIERLQIYQDAGAGALHALGLDDSDEIAALVRSVDRPVHVDMGVQGVPLRLADILAAGVKRIGIASALCVHHGFRGLPSLNQYSHA